MFSNSKMFSSMIAFLLIFAMIIPVGASTVQPRASDYLNSYSAYIYPSGWGRVQVWISVSGTEPMDEIGSLNIWLYESKDNETWTLVKNFRYVDYPDMLGYDDYYHSGHVQYQGVIGRYYKAYVCIWAGKDGNGDSRYFWTSAKKATLFAAETV